MEKIKYVHRQDCGFKLSAGNSGETSLNLSNEIFDLIAKGSMQLGEEKDVTFRLYKEDCIKAICFIVLKLPLYQSSSNSSSKIVDSTATFQKLLSKVDSLFGEQEIVDYTVNLYYRTDGRIYLNRLKVNNFSIRDVLVENNSAMLFREEADGKIAIRILSDIREGDTQESADANEDTFADPLQKIYYGAPGTGKSHEVKIQTGELMDDGTEQDLPNVFRTTFHPDTDYASFVGCYKPTMKPTTNAAKTLSGKEEEIVYEYVPQVFTDAYVHAYTTGEPTYLVIEEINRGNCAQIFGDLFQLLDRKNGVSEYTIKADKDLAKHLADVLGADSEGIKDGKLRLPANLHILATMNTSDQSLFPMDSAFKRRWEWEYVPIDYKEPKSGEFKITLGEKNYMWVDFIKAVNEHIFDLTDSEDKQMGNFFIKHSIDDKEFKSKVMFYLWYEVLRDETGNNKYFFHTKTVNDGKEVIGKFTFKDLYEDNAIATLQQFMEYLGVSAK